MSIRVTIPPEANRPKIRVTLDGQPITPLQLLAPKAPAPQAEPPPARVMAFWHAEDRIPPPWRYTRTTTNGRSASRPNATELGLGYNYWNEVQIS